MTARVDKDAVADEPSPPQLHGRRKLPEVGQFCLQVDRQTKGSYTTLASAEAAGMIIKKGYPVLQVAVYDRIQGINKILELPGA